MPSRSRSKSQSGFVQTDLLFVAVLGLWLVLSASGLVEWSVGRTVLGFVAVLFAPGYALVSALFPAKQTDADPPTGAIGDTGGPVRDDGTVSVVERLVLVVGVSVGVIPLLAIGLNYTPGGIHPSLLLSVIGAMTMLLTIVAAFRRWRVPAEERFSPRVFGRVFGAGSQIRRLRRRSTVTVLLVVGLVVAASGIGFAVLRADQGEQFTEFYIVTEDQTGEHIAGGYPEEMAPGETGRVQVGITNQEGETTTYTVVALLQSMSESGEIRQIQRLDRFTETVPDGETVTRTHTIQPEMSGEGLRVTYLLYVGSTPDDPTPESETAYRTVHFWIDVVPSGSG